MMNLENKLAPIVLFTYNRLWHTKQTIKALRKNKLTSRSELFIYSDGFKNANDKVEVLNVREYIKTIDGFMKVTIIEKSTNQGLADSIINGVTEIINIYGKVIVLEDDIVTSPTFLTFMNNALDYYENKDTVWHISGWNYPVDNINKEDTFMWRMMNCWGWATWKNRWQHYEKKPQKLIDTYTDYDIYKFDLDGTGGFWSQVIKNNSGIMNTWAIFWYAEIFNNKGLCLNPVQSYVENIGFDGSGTNTGIRNNYSSALCLKENINFTVDYYENDFMLYLIQNFFKNKNTKNLIFSQNINKIKKKLDSLDKSKEYILYGAGSGAQLILSFFRDEIKYIIDTSSNLKDLKVKNKNIFLPYGNTENYNIIISVFGRENIIKSFLITECNVASKNIISFDCS